MKVNWKGGIMLPAPGKHGYGFYELLTDDGQPVGEAIVHLRTDGRWGLSLATDREIDLDALDLPFVEDGGADA